MDREGQERKKERQRRDKITGLVLAVLLVAAV